MRKKNPPIMLWRVSQRIERMNAASETHDYFPTMHKARKAYRLKLGALYMHWMNPKEGWKLCLNRAGSEPWENPQYHDEKIAQS